MILPCLQRLTASGACLAARLLPGSCALCGRLADAAVCASCRRHAQPEPHGCRRCAAATGASSMLCVTGESSVVAASDPLCGRCMAEPPAFDASFAAARYAPPVDVLVQALKFRAQLPLAAAFSQWLLQAIAGQPDAHGDVVIAVPLSAERLAARGFNQAQEIARPLARALRLPLASAACVRVRDTLPQSALAPADRRDNMRGAFAVMDRQAIAGRRVLVVDDVMTTGHTLATLATCLKRHGAARVANLVVARTPLR